ncbi:MAG TPA: hypothetical protein VN132_06510, partial [Bdellovibrio sp.]|nr:hypothetical protein [Bdellovibrio sp.]
TRQNCGYENVQHTRPVTKTRTVTKYRDEDRCCQTQYRSVLDHQWNLKVQVQFPQGTELMDNEQETFTVEIAGSEAAADVKFTSVSTIFGYQILSKKVDHGVATVALKQVPRFKADDLKEKTLQNFTATPTAAGLTYQFLDNGQFPRVVSQHQIVLQDVVTHQVVAQSEVRANGQRQVAGDLAINWDYTHNYEVVLKIHRQGSVIEGGVVDFQITQPLQMVLDMAALKDENKISSSIVGSLNSAQIVFKDATLPYATVSTKYYISVIRKTIFGSNKVMAEKGYSRTSLKANGDGAFAISAKEIGVSDSDAKSYLSSGSKIQIVIQVDRVTSDGQKIEFWKSANVQVK